MLPGPPVVAVDRPADGVPALLVVCRLPAAHPAIGRLTWLGQMMPPGHLAKISHVPVRRGSPHRPVAESADASSPSGPPAEPPPVALHPQGKAPLLSGAASNRCRSDVVGASVLPSDVGQPGHPPRHARSGSHLLELARSGSGSGSTHRAARPTPLHASDRAASIRLVSVAQPNPLQPADDGVQRRLHVGVNRLRRSHFLVAVSDHVAHPNRGRPQQRSETGRIRLLPAVLSAMSCLHPWCERSPLRPTLLAHGALSRSVCVAAQRRPTPQRSCPSLVPQQRPTGLRPGPKPRQRRGRPA